MCRVSRYFWAGFGGTGKMQRRLRLPTLCRCRWGRLPSHAASPASSSFARLRTPQRLPARSEGTNGDDKRAPQPPFSISAPNSAVCLRCGNRRLSLSSSSSILPAEPSNPVGTRRRRCAVWCRRTAYDLQVLGARSRSTGGVLTRRSVAALGAGC